MNYDYHPISINDEATLREDSKLPVSLKASEQNHKKNKKQSSFDGLFLRRFFRILRLFFSPSKSEGNVITIWVSLIFISLLNEVLVYFVGTIPSRFYTALVGRDLESFKPLMVYAIAIVLGAGFSKGLVKFTGGLLAIMTRKILTRHLHSKYVNRNTLYHLLNYRTDIDNPDQRIAQDVENFSKTLRSICEEVIVTPILIIYYTYKTWSLFGYLGPLLIYAFFIFEIILSGFFINPLVNLVFMKEFHEGNFRFLHVRIRQFVEPIAFGFGEKVELYRLDSFLNNILKYQRKIVDRELFLGILIESFSSFRSIISYLVVAIHVFTGDYDGITKDKLVGLISMNAFLSLYLIYQFTRIVEQGTNISNLAGYTARIGQLMEAIENINDDIDNVDENYPISYYPGTEFSELTIEFDSVKITSPSGTSLLSNFKLLIEQGKNIMIIGPNGSGKTSILRIMCGLWAKTRGRVIRPNSRNQQQQKILVYLPQNPYLIYGSLRDQLTYPTIENVSDEDVRTLLARVNLTHIENMVETFDTQYGADWDKILSPCEQQRLAFARLFYWKPVFAALDKATSSLDSNTEKQFFDTCKELGITTITVSNNKGLLRYHDKVLLLDGKGGYATSDIDINGSKNIERWIDGTLLRH